MSLTNSLKRLSKILKLSRFVERQQDKYLEEFYKAPLNLSIYNDVLIKPKFYMKVLKKIDAMGIQA